LKIEIKNNNNLTIIYLVDLAAVTEAKEAAAVKRRWWEERGDTRSSPEENLKANEFIILTISTKCNS